MKTILSRLASIESGTAEPLTIWEVIPQLGFPYLFTLATMPARLDQGNFFW